MSKSSKRKKRSGLKNLMVIALVFIILGGIYYYVNIYMSDPHTVVSSEHQPEYTLLENKDSTKYEAIVMYTNNVNINTLANTFYKNNIFWPYIFIENKDVEGVKRNPLDIPKGVVLRIPKISDNMLDPANPRAVKVAKQLADSILNTSTSE
ncbi:hypothetical protein LJC00_02990 [Dysgonomonas sp. OttesenSCG-928-M03]|nr:hypothetical protein [Dysgonomonas sp. OttesenSCG-928-M03]